MDTKKFRVGVVGLGRMGSTIDEEGHTKLPYSIASAVESSPHFELVAGSDLILSLIHISEPTRPY